MKKINICSVLASLLIVCVLIGCTQEMVVPEKNGAPKIMTSAVSNVKATQALLSGTVEYERLENGKECYFLLSRYVDLSSAIRVEGVSKSRFSLSYTYKATVFNLVPDSKYYYKLCVTDGCSIIESDVKSFVTDETESITFSEAEVVDLGLSVKWASWNVGASAPEDFGCYFAWRDTELKILYDESTHKDLGVDIAKAMWGGHWRMPTKGDFNELLNKCSWEWITFNGTNGSLVTGPNGNSIFIPAAGYRKGTETLYRNSDGFYWSSGWSGYLVSCLCFGTVYCDKNSLEGGTCCYGRPVRPVYD